jgi:hypothetical protein
MPVTTMKGCVLRIQVVSPSARYLEMVKEILALAEEAKMRSDAAASQRDVHEALWLTVLSDNVTAAVHAATDGPLTDSELKELIGSKTGDLRL